MKKIIFLGLLIFASNNIIEFRDGVSSFPKFEVSPSKKAKTSYEIAAEYRYLLTNNAKIGVGIAYQNHRKLKKFTNIEDISLKADVKN